ncbi:uncharacterized protein FA14DRAFT_159677 [Meira miltonrushii]|uniref:Uncharacterized protein n=1 Tax=Meira miltonrushii TaxID=1280837 RepID=A0A316VJM7_9BASI|nr:uncharacterized protein FA14DRAFT_159677 [Meira miltonrushii]PWN37809.1 hypothetical protein FA14DRAFT_159677 [Meira miltonrushii]
MQDEQASEGKTQCKLGGVLNPSQLRMISTERNKAYKAKVMSTAQTAYKELLKSRKFTGTFDQFIEYQKVSGAVAIRAVQALDDSQNMANLLMQQRLEDRERRLAAGPSHHRHIGIQC